MAIAIHARTLGVRAALLLLMLAQGACTVSTRPVAVSDAVADAALKVEDFLRWPLQGPEGYDKAVAALLRTYRGQASSVAPPYLYARNAVRLSDGFSLAGAQVDNQYWHRAIASVSIAEQPCFRMSRAAEITGIQWTPPTAGLSPGRSFSVQRNGVKLTVAESSENPQCVVDISFVDIATTRRNR